MDRRLLVLALGMFALGTDSFVVAGILPQISHVFHASIGAAGQMTTAYALTYALLAPTIAALAAGIPRKRLLLIGLGLFVVSNLATTIAPSLGLALLARVLAGVGAATFSPTATGAGAMLVPPERRGFALSVIVAGLTTATALGSPIGAVIGGLSDWRWTFVFVAALGGVAFIGVWALLPEMELAPAITLGKRIAPIADARVALTLATTLLAMSGIFTVYTYFSVVFDHAVGGQAIVLGVLLVMWGATGTVSNLLAGRLIDSFGSHKVIVLMLGLLVVDMVSFPWTSLHVWSAALAIAVGRLRMGHTRSAAAPACYAGARHCAGPDRTEYGGHLFWRNGGRHYRRGGDPRHRRTSTRVCRRSAGSPCATGVRIGDAAHHGRIRTAAGRGRITGLTIPLAWKGTPGMAFCLASLCRHCPWHHG
ncbi:MULTISPECIES: MFS transporter [Burkholderia]|uniref:MFS transporter n=1 Tax=Burkholderia TaxID=32008 RepID=UPI00119A4D11|nr:MULTISPECIES: MFS transporter [unclassified Burkholderia]TWC72107.1 putative MFS family arabinose efflux permease [Burkholderia sp. SJZ089]TWD02511.1 putative MFS family arabinose efflux permease [Burkholderia sp. SJZ115]TWD06785.1 putative MFS family arabinose efflux permease [Burkholderia sp. SJZ091]